MRQGDEILERWYEQLAGRRGQEAARQTEEERQAFLLAMLRDSLGEFESADSFEPILLERVACDGYIRERVELSAIPGLTFGAYVLIPNNAAGTNPAVIAVHGHGYGSRQICGMKADGSADTGEDGLYRQFAVQLAKQGLVVIAPDVVGFGERKLASDLDKDPNIANSCYTMATRLLMLGKTLTGLRVKEMGAVLDYIAERPEVDPARIGIAGFSGGALIGYVVAALDERIQAALLCGFPNTFKDSIWDIRHCLCNYTPGILATAELPELLGLIAPRPLFLESGSDDPIFPAAGFEQAVSVVRAVYERANAANCFAHDLFPGVHEISGRRSFEWLAQHL